MAKKLVVVNDSGDAYCVDPNAGTITRLSQAPPAGEGPITPLDPGQAQRVGCDDAVAMIIMAKL